MDTVTVSRRNNTKHKGDKENSQPAGGGELSESRGGKASAVPLQLRGNRTDTSTDEGSLKTKSKPVLSGDAMKKLKTDGKGAAEFKRQTHSQVVLRKQVSKHQKHAAVPPTAAPPSKCAPGMYRGRVVQSKIGSLWKSSDSLRAADPKPQNPRPEKVAKKSRSQSVAVVSRHGLQNPTLMRPNLVSDKPVLVTKTSSVNGPAGFCSNWPPARTVSATLTSARPRNATVASVKPRENQKPKVPATDKKVNKPAVTSTLSQYRCSMETAEERRIRLAEWLASKGKTLKRPAMTMAAPSKLKVPDKAKAYVQLTVGAPVIAAELHTINLQSEVSARDTEDTPGIKDATLDLLNSSYADPQDHIDDIVMNLCDALEAMVTPSNCSDEVSRVKDDCKVDPKCFKLEENCKKPGNEMKQTAEETEDQKVDDVERCDHDKLEKTPEMSSASIIKYSVKTTPFLQSVKRTIEDEVSTSTRKSSIKDLKFLTPVRRSCRIQRKSSHLPTMLMDPDPCVSSLAELVKLDNDPTAYIYRKNPALLQELPDQGP